ncbi:hypothetical protein Bpfe_002495 [Biomphalaria pfeifferi]|uniref:Uncharacterized protein n=1 Tax=Biomphalaria pfeifferi TaxID=112525 RepID=A0AAD8C8X8_BIOPF|nr:hypothetical protein Bpfe_002495 [Biomphalaria pfeifferi]
MHRVNWEAINLRKLDVLLRKFHERNILKNEKFIYSVPPLCLCLHFVCASTLSVPPLCLRLHFAGKQQRRRGQNKGGLESCCK